MRKLAVLAWSVLLLASPAMASMLRFNVWVPSPDAIVTVDGMQTRSVGVLRTYQVDRPDIATGQEYDFNVAVTFNGMTQNQIVRAIGDAPAQTFDLCAVFGIDYRTVAEQYLGTYGQQPVGCSGCTEAGCGCGEGCGGCSEGGCSEGGCGGCSGGCVPPTQVENLQPVMGKPISGKPLPQPISGKPLVQPISGQQQVQPISGKPLTQPEQVSGKPLSRSAVRCETGGCEYSYPGYYYSGCESGNCGYSYPGYYYSGCEMGNCGYSYPAYYYSYPEYYYYPSNYYYGGCGAYGCGK